ncbi:MAG: fatty acid--CoA ligase family protein [Chloroflexota bacterium]
MKFFFCQQKFLPVVESYGQSELGGFVAPGYPRAEHGSKFNAIGPELPDREVRIADEQDNEVPIGTPGEILIRGGVMIGYHNLPEKTAEALRNGWLHTGDMGVMDEDGYIRLVGRWSERILMHGKVIFPRPLEEALLRHPAVRYACVIAKKDPQAGQVPKAVVELYPDASATPEELMKHCNAVLGEENTIRVIEIIPQMPMTPTGKIGRADLQAREDLAV